MSAFDSLNLELRHRYSVYDCLDALVYELETGTRDWKQIKLTRRGDTFFLKVRNEDD